MTKSDRQDMIQAFLGYGGCLLLGVLMFAAVVFTLAAATKWVVG